MDVIEFLTKTRAFVEQQITLKAPYVLVTPRTALALLDLAAVTLAASSIKPKED